VFLHQLACTRAGCRRASAAVLSPGTAAWLQDDTLAAELLLGVSKGWPQAPDSCAADAVGACAAPQVAGGSALHLEAGNACREHQQDSAQPRGSALQQSREAVAHGIGVPLTEASSAAATCPDASCADLSPLVFVAPQLQPAHLAGCEKKPEGSTLGPAFLEWPVKRATTAVGKGRPADDGAGDAFCARASAEHGACPDVHEEQHPARQRGCCSQLTASTPSAACITTTAFAASLQPAQGEAGPSDSSCARAHLHDGVNSPRSQ
jgi:hypothetical protein